MVKSEKLGSEKLLPEQRKAAEGFASGRDVLSAFEPATVQNIAMIVFL